MCSDGTRSSAASHGPPGGSGGLSAASRNYGQISHRCPESFPLPVPGARGRLPLRYARDLRPLAAIPLDAIFAFRGTLLNVQLDIGMSPRFEASPAAPLGNGGHARIRCHICEAEY